MESIKIEMSYKEVDTKTEVTFGTIVVSIGDITKKQAEEIVTAFNKSDYEVDDIYYCSEENVRDAIDIIEEMRDNLDEVILRYIDYKWREIGKVEREISYGII